MGFEASNGGARSVQGNALATGSREGIERWRREQRAGEGSTADWGHGEERTANMPLMLVTLAVSKLSGWLNADADCRVERGA